jgi:hypothetical protein
MQIPPKDDEVVDEYLEFEDVCTVLGTPEVERTFIVDYGREVHRMPLQELIHNFAIHNNLITPKFTGSVNNWEVNIIDPKQIGKFELTAYDHQVIEEYQSLKKLLDGKKMFKGYWQS